MDRIDIIPSLPDRPDDGHKGLFGKVLIIAGSTGMSGAAALAGKAALRSGAGLVRLAVPKDALPIVAALEPCYTTIALPQDHHGRLSRLALPSVLNLLAENDVIAFGPGIGNSGDIQAILRHLIGLSELKLVIDADGLNALAKIHDWPTSTRANVILTPHPGEMKRLWASVFRTTMPTDRIHCASTFTEHTRTTLVLKGHQSVVTNGEHLYVNQTGNPGMATGGSGDVLAGIVTALWGQGLNPLDACILGTYVHGLAGDIGAQQLGQTSLIATDLIDMLPQAFQQARGTDDG